MIQSYQETTDRNFVLYTGVEGARQMTSYIQRANDADYVKFLLEKGHVQKEQHDTILDMINSQDEENHTMASQILRNIK